MELEGNMIKKLIFLCLTLVLSCFGDELKVKHHQNEQKIRTRENSNSGWFFGIGLGGGLNHFKLTSLNKSAVSYEDFPSFVTEVQIGGYRYFNEWVLRYYYSLDLDFNPGKDQYSGLPIQNSTDAIGFSGYSVFYYHMLNLDFILDLYSNSMLDVGMVLGFGGGIIDGRYGPKRHGYYFTKLASYGFINWDIRANAGMRLLFNHKYGVELMMRIMPLTKLINVGVYSGERILRPSSQSLTLNFVMEL